jgi:hypothetical protein
MSIAIIAFILVNTCATRTLLMHMEYQAGDLMTVYSAGKKQYYVGLFTGKPVEIEDFIYVLPLSG